MKEVKNTTTDTIYKNKMLFIKRFCYLASNAELLYTLLHTSFFKNQMYEIIETILFDNNREEFDYVVYQLNELKNKIQIVEYDDNLNYTSLILSDMFSAVTNHAMSIKLKSKKINMLIQYNNFFDENSRSYLTVEPTEEEFSYSTTKENDFINAMAHHTVGSEELEKYIEQEKKKTLKK